MLVGAPYLVFAAVPWIEPVKRIAPCGYGLCQLAHAQSVVGASDTQEGIDFVAQRNAQRAVAVRCDEASAFENFPETERTLSDVGRKATNLASGTPTLCAMTSIFFAPVYDSTASTNLLMDRRYWQVCMVL